jgi:hypothetical protein
MTLFSRHVIWRHQSYSLHTEIIPLDSKVEEYVAADEEEGEIFGPQPPIIEVYHVGKRIMNPTNNSITVSEVIKRIEKPKIKNHSTRS